MLTSASSSGLREMKLWKRPSSVITFPVNSTSSNSQQDDLHHAIARYMFGNNVPLKTLKSPHFKNLLEALHRGYKGLSYETLVNKILPAMYTVERKKMATEMANTMVTMSIDGWTAPLHQSVLGATMGPVCLPPPICLNLSPSSFIISILGLPSIVRAKHTHLRIWLRWPTTSWKRLKNNFQWLKW